MTHYTTAYTTATLATMARDCDPALLAAHVKMQAALVDHEADSEAITEAMCESHLMLHDHYPMEHPISIMFHRDYALAHMRLGQWDAAIDTAATTLGYASAVFPSDHEQVETVRVVLGTVLLNAGRVEEGTRVLEVVANSSLDFRTVSPEYRAMVLEGLAAGSAARGDNEECAEYLEMADALRSGQGKT